MMMKSLKTLGIFVGLVVVMVITSYAFSLISAPDNLSVAVGLALLSLTIFVIIYVIQRIWKRTGK